MKALCVARTTCSIGFVCYPLLRAQPDVVPWDDVLNLADTAMYQAKEERNAWVGYIGGDSEPSAASMRTALQGSPAKLAEEGALVIRRSSAAAGVTPRVGARLGATGPS